MDYSLNNEEVASIAGRDITMIPYTDICMYNDISDLFATECVLLNYQSSNNYGHWVGLFKKRNKIYFFDSYGKMPDEQLEYIPVKYRIESNQDYPYLVELLKRWMEAKSGRSIHYNSEQFQRYSGRIRTCGRWVGYFFRFAENTSIEQFEEDFNEVRDNYFQVKKPKSIDRDMFFDRLIVKLTNELL